MTLGDAEPKGPGAGLDVQRRWGLHRGGDAVPSTAGQEGHGAGQGGAVRCHRPVGSALTRPRRSPSSAVESKSTVSILDDIGSMFDDLADQLDAMLE